MLKYYIAYKAETNFVDIVPLANSLSLMLNMPFEMLIDTNHVAQDVAEVGRWGNGEVEVKLTSLDEIPYVLSLINQSFEHQMGNGKLED
jgi:predicted transport protein